MLQNKDQFGFYRVGDLKFYSKLQAIEMHQRTGVHPHWDFNEAVFSSYDWTKEPTESLNELYRQRAQQIRDEYDYVVVWYSGAPDSDCVAYAFLKNGIKVDEFASYINYDATGEKDNFLNNEIFKVAQPKVESVFRPMQPDIVYRTVDISKALIDNFESNGTDWIYTQNSMFSPNNSARQKLRSIVPEWRDIIDSGKKLAFVWGCDKPRMYQVDGRYCLRFLDLLDSCVTPYQQSMNIPGEYDELFFWSPALPKLLIKQGHIIKNYLKHANETDQYLTKTPTLLAYKDINNERYWLSKHGLHKLIYPYYEFNADTAGKTPSVFFSPRDTWFYNLSAETYTARDSWWEGLKKLQSSIPDYWKNDPNDPNLSLKLCISIPYFLE